METMLHSGMNEFIAAIYRQHQNAAYMNAAYLESYKELAKLQAQHEQAITNEHLRRLESCEKIRDVESSKKRKDSKVNNICILCAAFSFGDFNFRLLGTRRHSRTKKDELTLTLTLAA